MISKLKLAHGIFTCLALVCGIVYCIIVERLFDFIFQKVRRVDIGYTISTAVWMIGLAYVVPAVVGVIAMIIRNKKIPFNIQSVLGIVSFIVLLVIFFTGLAAVKLNSSVQFCEEKTYICKCESTDLERLKAFFACDEINTLVRMGVASDAMFFGGGIVTLIASVLGLFVARTVGHLPPPPASTYTAPNTGHENPAGPQVTYSQPIKPRRFQHNQPRKKHLDGLSLESDQSQTESKTRPFPDPYHEPRPVNLHSRSSPSPYSRRSQASDSHSRSSYPYNQPDSHSRSSYPYNQPPGFESESDDYPRKLEVNHVTTV